MRFGLVHRVMTHTLAALGLLAVVSTSSMAEGANVIVLVGLALALAVPESWQADPDSASAKRIRWLATIGPLSLLVVQTVRLVLGRSMLEIAVEFAALLQVIRIGTRRGAAHDQQIIVLALLHFVAGTVLGGGLSYGLCFLGFLVFAPGALVLSHLRREVEGNYRQGARDRTGLPVDVPRILRSRRVVGRGFLLSTCLLAIPIFIFTGALFVMFPRVGLSLLLLSHPRSGRMVGFSDKVDLGEVGVLRSDPLIALRFDVPDLPEPPPNKPNLTLRLRGTAFDVYNGRAWSRSQERRDTAVGDGTSVYISRPPDPRRDPRIIIELEPIDPPVVFLPQRAVALKILPQSHAFGEGLGLQRGPEGELRYTGSESRGLRYEVYVAPEKEPIHEALAPRDRARYLAVPPSLPRRFSTLARTWTEGQATPLAKARALEDHLKHEFAYDTASPSQGKEQPVDHFLFESRRGHCEFFSTAMAMMLREIGIPSRNVTGFVGGTYNRFGHYYAVRQGDAHSWVEGYLEDEQAWVTFDPTPTAGAQPLPQASGWLVYMRDLFDAMTQRWNRYVVGYDIRTQTRIFNDIAARYDRARRQAGVDRGPADRLTRGPVVAGGGLLLFLGAYIAWRRRARRGPGKASEKEGRSGRAEETATRLYRTLEAALSVQGVSRPPTTPPARHAADLAKRRHPLAEEVGDLTEIYLEARFGRAAISEATRQDFERRARAIRSYRPPKADARSGSQAS